MIITIQSVVIPASITIFIAIIFLFSSFIVTTSSFPQSDNSNNNSTSQTMKNMSQSANQTVDDHLQQAVNQTSGKASDGDDSNIPEEAKNIRKNLTEVAKKLGETINKKMNDLAK